jgi:curved DNA-binding protein CbpA
MTPGQQGNGDGLYVRLEVVPGASHDEIARAYRRLAHDAHPDARPGDPDAARRFREITEAYEVLGDPDRRQQYDQGRRQARTGSEWPSPAPGRTSSGPGRAPVSTPPTVTGGPLVFLGTGPRTGPYAQLLVGPVQVEASATRPPTAFSQDDFVDTLLARLLSDLFGPRWRS